MLSLLQLVLFCAVRFAIGQPQTPIDPMKLAVSTFQYPIVCPADIEKSSTSPIERTTICAISHVCDSSGDPLAPATTPITNSNEITNNQTQTPNTSTISLPLCRLFDREKRMEARKQKHEEKSNFELALSTKSKQIMTSTPNANLELHSWPTPNGLKISIFLAEAGIAHTIVPVRLRSSAVASFR